MNFFSELEAFIEWQSDLPADRKLSEGAVALWIYLLYRCNCCALPSIDGRWLWRVEFFVRPEGIEHFFGRSERNIRRYRKELVDAGRLKYQKAVKNRRKGVYTLIPFAYNVAPTRLKNLADETVSVFGLVDKYAG